MVGGRAAARSILLFVGAAPLAQPAHAGAWSLAEGTQQWSATVSRETGDFGQAWRADDYTEYGLGDGWGLTTKVETDIRIDTTYDDRSQFRIGIQRAFAITDRASFALQASLIGGEALEGPECQGEGYEARAAIGTSFSLFGREGYANAEAAQRSRGTCSRTVTEFATGLEFVPAWNLTFKAWTEQGGGARSTKAEIGLSHDFGGMSVGAGWREEISGEFEEKGWVLTAGMKF
jgi:hypothetical protein